MAKITIQPLTLSDWQDSTVTQLRIYCKQAFTASTGEYIPRGTPDDGTVYQALTCTYSSVLHTLTIPSFEIDSTRDGIDFQTSRYSAYFFTTDGTLARPFDGFTNFWVPATISSTSGCSPSGTCCTWAELKVNNFGSPALPIDTFYTKAQVDRLIAGIGTVTAITSINALTPIAQLLVTDTAGSDFNIASAVATHTFNLPTASSTVRGALASADWSTFNAKQAALTFGNLTVGTGLTVSGGTGAVVGAGALVSLGSLVVTSVVNDTNIQGSIAANALTLAWAGTLAKARQHSATVYNDQNNSFGAFYEEFSQIAAPSSPASGTRRLYVDSGTGELSVRTSSGTTVSLESSASGSGTVNTGVAGSLAVYPSNGTTVDDLTLGSANQILGTTNAATANEYKTLVAGSAGTDFAIAHTANTVTFNLPSASAANRGVVTTGAQTIAGAKVFSTSVDAIIISSALASLPTAGSTGRLYYLTDGPRGLVVDQGTQFYNLNVDEINVKAYGAKVDGKLIGDAAMTPIGSTHITSGSAGWVVGRDEGKRIAIDGAGTAGATLMGLITVVNSSSDVTVDFSAITAVSVNNCWFGTDDTTALTNAIAAVNANGSVIRIPSGRMVLSGAGLTIGNGAGTISSVNGVRIIGAGGGKTQISFQGGATEIWWFGNASVPILTFAGPISGCGVEGIFFDCKVGANAATSAIRAVWMHKSKLWDICVTGHSSYGIDIDSSATPIVGANLGSDDNIIGEMWLGPPSSTTGGGLRLGAADTSNAACSRNQVMGVCAYSGTDAASAGLNLRFVDSNTFYGVTTFAQGSGKGLLISTPASNALYPAAQSFYNCALQGGTSVSGAWAPASKTSFFPYSTADGELIPTDTGFNGVTTGTTLPSSLPPTWFGAFTLRDLWTFQTNPLVSNTAPGMVFTDTTASAKSLTIAVDANFANIRESAGASGSLVMLDLANARVGIGTATPSTKLHVVPSDPDAALRVEAIASRIDMYSTLGGGSNWAFRSENSVAGDFMLTQSATTGADAFGVGSSKRMYFFSGSIALGTSIAVTASGSTGFVYIPTSTTFPTGAPTITGNFAALAPIHYDVGNGVLCTYNPNVTGWYMVGPRVVRAAADFSKTSDTTLANVTNMTHNVAAGKKYAFRAVLYTTSNVAGGIKFAVGGTATATTVIYDTTVQSGGAANVITTSRATALATAVGQVTAVTVATCIIEGTIDVNAAGTLTIQFAQNASNGTASVVLANSTLELKQAIA